MLGPITEANRHHSKPLEFEESRRSESRTRSSRNICHRSGWDREEAEIADRLRDLPEKLASLESFRE